MHSLRSLALPLLALALLAAPAAAQTTPAPKTMPRKTTHATTPPTERRGSGTNTGGKGLDVYAAPGEPVNVRQNGKNTPPYDGPAAGHGTTSKGMTMPRKQ